MLALIALIALVGSIWYNYRRSGTPYPFFGYVGLGAVYFYARFWHRCRWIGVKNIPLTGPAIFVSNHTSSPDGPYLQGGSPRAFTFLIAEEFFLPPVNFVWRSSQCVPVNRSGSDHRAVRLALQRLHEGRAVLVFPEGNLSGAGSGKQRTPKAGAAFFALHSGAPVYPIHISGGHNHHRIAESWLYPARKPVRVIFGKQIDLSAYLNQPITRPLIERTMACIMREVHALPDSPS